MKLKDFILKYFNDLPNRWSANFLAFMAFNNILLAIVAYIIATIYQFIAPKEALLQILELPILIPVFAFALLPISCIITGILIFTFIRLLKTNNSKIYKQNFIILFMILSICFSLMIPFFDFTSGGGIYLVFIPIFLFWIPVSVFIIYLIILCLENHKKLEIQNSILLENKFYKKYLKFLFIYGFIMFGIIENLLLICAILFNIVT